MFLLKHRIRADESYLFASARSVATKIIIPFDGSDLRTGGRSLFVEQRGYEDMLWQAENFSSKSLDRDLTVLGLLNTVPSLAPFLPREHLRYNKIEVAPCYFAISEGDQERMYRFVNQEYSRLIHESGSHLLELINSVLDMSKIEAGKFELSEELFELEETAQSAVRLLRIPAERAGVALKLVIAPNVRLIFADRRSVKQILVNLLSNGVKYTPPGGEVRVTARALGEPGRGVEIIVSDSGTGISKTDLARLGKPFEQVENAETRAKEGTGLGLALVKSLALMHGGAAILESALGEGTTVTVRLPHAAVDAKGERIADANILPFRAVS